MSSDHLKYHLENRKFLHDLANPLATLSLSLNSFIKHMNTEFPDSIPANRMALLKKVIEAAGQMGELHADFKKNLSVRESENENLRNSPTPGSTGGYPSF